MAWAIERLSWPKLNPDFFAYGQFPLYLTYFSLPKPILFNQAIWGLRFWSVVFSLLTVVVGYLLAKVIFKKQKYASITALLLIFTPGLIQTAHFGTTESILTFVGVSSAYLAVKYYQTENLKYLILAGFVGAIGMASKLNAALFLFAPFLAVLLRTKRFRRLFLLAGVSLILTFIFSPYYFLRFDSFWRTLNYEANVARGISPVFYTRQFIDTIPFWFQFNKVFPWVLGLPMFAVLIFSFLIFLKRFLKLKFKILNSKFYILTSSFLPWFIFNSLLFAKWTRFMIPILPFLILFIVWGIKELKMKSAPATPRAHRGRAKLKIFHYLILFFLILPGVIFMKIYFQPDIRVQASRWMNENLPAKSKIVYEGGNVIDLPDLDREKFQTFSVDFYNLENNQLEQEKLRNYLDQADYYLIPSRRLFANYLRLPDQYPETAEFYRRVFDNDSQFKLVKEFSPFGRIGRGLLGSDLRSEETWTVFDHPTIRLFEIN